MAAAPTDSTIAPRSASLSSPSLQGPWSNRTFRLATKALVTALGVFTIWRYAWMSDDALITLRTSLNWAHGYGPVFNPDERVAGYTHPLWMALLTLMGAVSGSWIVGTLITSVILAGIALGILVFRSRNLWQLVTTASFVLLSNTLVNWGTSGLEGPLAIALLSGLFVLQSRDGEVRHPLLSGFVLSLLLLCRMDYLLLLAPWLLWATKQTWIHPVRTIRLWTGLTLPLAAWALISWQYYGFILPSTFEAKPASLTRNSWAAVWTTYGSVSVSIPPYWSFWSACRFSGLPIENALQFFGRLDQQPTWVTSSGLEATTCWGGSCWYPHSQSCWPLRRRPFPTQGR